MQNTCALPNSVGLARAKHFMVSYNKVKFYKNSASKSDHIQIFFTILFICQFEAACMFRNLHCFIDTDD